MATAGGARRRKFKNFMKVMFQGWKMRTLYYGFQSTIFFLYLNHIIEHLKIDPVEFEENDA